ncbi:chlorophyll a,b binding protein CP29 [Raphidocelis subcapitata]|uniref:Chlorophyll a-b binding protein, chloroplastic n=1 Tax=Raphidocelis subcapitata TaxID=307507 RepID=A0A2V0PBT8_9CHLO|nr:chlorophyll a,b binding protein CP29 [Raphidocelis subcapitata]|eukprot:GBF96999.1 chlorophyll a,b binding protein CP29 [Raphidocelis subcapitata]
MQLNARAPLSAGATKRGSVQARATKKVATPTATRSGGVGYRKYDGDALWLPNTTRPEWLDGSLPGDRGFDPLGLSRPSDFMQIGVDQNDINAPKNFKGDVEGKAATVADIVSETSLSPYSEVFGLQRFRETELIHGRWAMLGVLGALVAEGVTGQNWIDAAKAELASAPQYWNNQLPWSINTAAVFNSLLMGGAEFYRNSQLEPEKRCYPGGFFDPLNFADPANPERAFQLKTAEIKHGRLAMVAALGFAVQAAAQGEGALGSLSKFGATF